MKRWLEASIAVYVAVETFIHGYLAVRLVKDWFKEWFK